LSLKPFPHDENPFDLPSSKCKGARGTKGPGGEQGDNGEVGM